MREKLLQWIRRLRQALCVHDWMTIEYTVPGYTKFRCLKCGKSVYVKED